MSTGDHPWDLTRFPVLYGAPNPQQDPWHPVPILPGVPFRMPDQPLSYRPVEVTINPPPLIPDHIAVGLMKLAPKLLDQLRVALKGTTCDPDEVAALNWLEGVVGAQISQLNRDPE